MDRILQNDQVLRAASALNISPKKIIVSPQVGTPAVIGLFRPKIYLPDISLPHEEWIWILKHERQHMRNGDIWIEFLYLLLEAVCCWNPYMHRVAKKLGALLEFRCDYLVTKGYSEAETQVYLLSILHILSYINLLKEDQSSKQRSRMHAYMVYTQADLLLRNRFEAIQNPRPKQPLAHTAIALGCIALFLSSYFFLFQPPEDIPVKKKSPIASKLLLKTHIFFKLMKAPMNSGLITTCSTFCRKKIYMECPPQILPMFKED